MISRGARRIRRARTIKKNKEAMEEPTGNPDVDENPGLQRSIKEFEKTVRDLRRLVNKRATAGDSPLV